ncbi:MAG TPA: DUF6795 domain-containing protein [Pyrinomonadaceae bacterium]|jgi:hypothetical protein
MASKQVWRRILLVVAILAAIALLYPAESTVCPAWRIQVVDGSGKPLKNAWVRQHWQDYSVESNGHEEDSYTDVNGYISFPERSIRASLLFRILGAILNTLSQGVHASYGAHAYIAAYGNIVDGKRLEGSVSYQEGESLPKQLVTYVNDLHLR